MTAGKDLDILLGDPRRAILSMVLPFFLAAAVVQINSFVDTFWISGLGSTAGSAISTVAPVYELLTCAGVGIGVGATTTIAFRIGRGDVEDASRLVAQSITLSVICAVIASLALLVLYNPIIDMMGAGDVRSAGMEYLLPYLVLSPILLCQLVIGADLRGEGAARASTAVQLSAAVFNMVIDPLFIYGLGWGLSGAALSTCVSSLLALVMGVSWYARGVTALKPSLRGLRPSRSDMAEILEVGGPRTVQSVISSVIDLLQRIFIIIAGGTTGVMFYNFTWRYIGLVSLPSKALDSAMVPVCSAAFGRDDAAAVRAGFRYVVRTALVISLLTAVLFFLFADPLASVMMHEGSMLPLKGEFVWTLAVSALVLPTSAFFGIGSSMMQVLRRSKVPMYFHLVWGVSKLVVYSLACTVSFHALIYSMVVINTVGGLAMLAMAVREYGRRFPDTPFFG